METGLLKSKDIFGKPKAEKLGSQFGGGWSISEIVKEEQEAVAGIKTSAEIFGEESEESKFQKAYKAMATKQGLSSDPDDPKHFYDYRALYKETGSLDPDATGHFPSKYKKEGHPEMVVEGIDTRTGDPVPQLEDMKVQENNIVSMSKTYADLGQSLDADYEVYEKLTEEIDKLEESMQEAPPDMQFLLNQKRSGLVAQHNELVDKLKLGTKKHQELYTQLESESKLFNMNVNSYNQYLEIEAKTQPREDLPEYIKESDAKDVFDAFRLGSSGIFHNSKQFFSAALPNLIYKDITVKETVTQYAGMTQSKVDKVNEFNKGQREIYKEKYQKGEDQYYKWLEDHPELNPRPEWSKGVMETVKNNPGILKDPAYWCYVAAQSAAFTLGIMGTTLAATAVTGNPFLGMAAGVAVAYPSQAQDLWQELVDNGATEEQASKLAVPIGAVIAAVEVMGDLPLLATVSKPFKQMLSRNITAAVGKKVADSILKSGLKTYTKIQIAEIIEEVLQGAIQDATVKTFNEDINLLEKIPETILQTAIAVTPFSVFGMGADVRSNINERLKQKIAENNIKTALEEVTLPEEKEPVDLTPSKQTVRADLKEAGIPIEFVDAQIKEGKTAVKILEWIKGQPGLSEESNVYTTVFAENLKAVIEAKETLEIPKIEIKAPGEIYTGEAFRAESGLMVKGKTAQEIVNFEAEELGNVDIKEKAEEIAEKMKITLEEVAEKDVIWVADTLEVADRYGGGEKVEISKDNIILADDGEGGYLIINNVDQYKKVEPEPVPPVPKIGEGQREFMEKRLAFLEELINEGTIQDEENVTRITNEIATIKEKLKTEPKPPVVPEEKERDILALPLEDLTKEELTHRIEVDRNTLDHGKGESLEWAQKDLPKAIELYKDRFETLKEKFPEKEEEKPVDDFPQIAGMPKEGIPKTAISFENTVEALEAEAVRLGKPSWEKLTRVEIRNLLDKVRAFKDPGGKLLLKKVGVPAIIAWKDEDFAKIGILAGEKVHKVTNSHWIFIDDKVADEVIAEQKKRMYDKLVKEYMRNFPDASKALAEEYATNQFKGWTEGKEAPVFPDWKPILETAEKARTKDKTYIQGHITGERENFTILSNGLIQVQMNSNYLNMINKWLPDAEIQLGKKSLDMVSIVDPKTNKIQAIVMPVRFDEEGKLPWEVWDVPGGVKPKVEKADVLVEEEILNALPERPDFHPINANVFTKIIDKYSSKKFFESLYKLHEEGKLEVNEEAAGTRVFKAKAEEEEEAFLERPTKPQETLFPGMEEPQVEEQELSARTWGQEMEKEEVTPKRINKTEIMTWADKAFGFPIKGKATHKWKAAGIFYHHKQIIRMQKWGELAVAAHEIAHGIDDQISEKLYNKWKWGERKGITGEFTKELADLDYDQGDSGRRTAEGFAEYMRFELTQGLGEEKAPNFHKYFNESILPQFPEIKKNLDLFKQKLDIWNKQGAENRIIQHIDWKGEHSKTRGLLPKIQKALEWVNVRFNDEFYFPQKIVRGIEKIIGKKLSPSKNPAILMEYSKAKSGAIARTFVMKNAIDEHGNVVGESLTEILKPIPNKEISQFIAYAVSMRASTLSARGIESGFDIDDAKFIIEKYKDKGWKATAKEVTEWSNHMLDWIVRAGGLSDDAAKLMRTLNPIYLPFKRAFLDEISVTKGVGGYVDTGRAVKAIKGSGRPIINPIESLITQTRELIAKAQKIRIAKAFIDLAEEHGVGGFVTKVPAPMKATTFSANQIKNYLNDLIKKRTEGIDVDIEEGETIMLGNYDDFLTVFTQDFKYSGKENIVSVWRDGKQEFYEIHPDLYEAFKGVDPLKLGAIAKVFAPYARMLRLGATGLKLSFGLARNPFRDAFSYAVFSKRNNTTIFDPIKGYYTEMTTKPGEATWRFKALGGGLSGQIGLDRASVQNSYDEMLDKKLGKIGIALHVVKHPVNTLADLVSITEMGPRSAEIEASYKKYTSEKWQKDHPDWTEEDAFIQAFCDAQDVTVNFTKSGKWAKQINQVTAFFNVAIRGPEKLYRSIKERPIQTFVKGTLWLTTIAVASWYRNKDKDWYKNLPPAYKYNNLFFEINGEVFRLPIPFELGIIFMSAPQAVLDTMQDKDSKSLEGLLDLAKAQIPDPTPSVFQPAIDVATNKNFLGVPIESEGMQYLYPTERKKDYTTRLAIALSKGMDKIGIQLSPIQLDYMLDSYSGGFLRQFRISGEELEDLPILGDLMLRDPFYPKRQLNEYFSDWEVLRQKKQSGIATRAEIRELNRIDGFYSTYKVLQGNITKAKKANNQALVVKYSNLLRERLERYGY